MVLEDSEFLPSLGDRFHLITHMAITLENTLMKNVVCLHEVDLRGSYKVLRTDLSNRRSVSDRR